MREGRALDARECSAALAALSPIVDTFRASRCYAGLARYYFRAPRAERFLFRRLMRGSVSEIIMMMSLNIGVFVDMLARYGATALMMREDAFLFSACFIKIFAQSWSGLLTGL